MAHETGILKTTRYSVWFREITYDALVEAGRSSIIFSTICGLEGLYIPLQSSHIRFDHSRPPSLCLVIAYLGLSLFVAFSSLSSNKQQKQPQIVRGGFT